MKHPQLRKLGKIRCPRPPKRIAVMQRYLNRAIINIEQVLTALREDTAEMNVRTFHVQEYSSLHMEVKLWARFGCICSVIEVMPVAYTCESLKLLSSSCYTRYF